MVDKLVVEFLKRSLGKNIVFWNHVGFRFQGNLLLCDDEFLVYHDFHKDDERLFKLSEIREVTIDAKIKTY